MQNGQINRKVRIKNASKIKTAIVIAIAVSLVGARCSHFNYERRIANFVTQNETELTALAEEYLEKTEQKEIGTATPIAVSSRDDGWGIV